MRLFLFLTIIFTSSLNFIFPIRTKQKSECEEGCPNDKGKVTESFLQKSLKQGPECEEGCPNNKGNGRISFLQNSLQKDPECEDGCPNKKGRGRSD